MNLKVFKFGGSSLSTPDKICAVAKRISILKAEDPNQRFIIVTSAMGKTTDELNGLARQVSPKPNRRELDMLLTTGERVSMALMSIALNDLGCPAISFTGSQAGIMTDGSFTNARIQELKPIRVEEALRANKIVVLAGFQGVDPMTKEITTLGRGGSDTTAVAMAAHFKAESCAFLKDVDGVLNADPKFIPSAKMYSHLPIEVLYEFCFWGAKILNCHSVEMAKKKGVKLRIGRSDNFKIGTEIDFSGSAFKSGDFLGMNYHRYVHQLVVFCSSEDEGLRIFSDTLSSFNLPAPHKLTQKFSKEKLSLVIALEPEDNHDFISAIKTNPSLQLQPGDFSTITISKFALPPEIKIISRDQLHNVLTSEFDKNILR